ncbi:MAG: ribosomal protein [Clostridiaceae bacterium]|jgi:uncharacterized protein YsxB (DUF464 family)|nr:ribosomal protein [Clostridiaceae bacterium]
MINVEVLKKNNNIVFIETKGHADYDEYGKDIVCSAVSALCTTTLNGIIEVLHIEPEYSIHDNGFLSIGLKRLTMDEIKACQVLMKTLLLGLQNIEIGYSEYINLKVEEVQ